MAKKKTESKEGKRPRLVLLDSHAILHRGYHALPDFTTSRGEPVGALYGLITILLRINEDLDPDYMIACRDLPGGTIRHEVYKEYKGTRAEIDNTLIVQLERAPEVFKAFGVPVYSAAGYEADDCLGTIAHQVRGNGLDTIIASGDMDTLQLVDDSTRVFTMRKGINDVVMYDAEAVVERYGFGPESVVDYKALRGDPSDNIPGVKGIGEKTATELIQKFGSLDDIYKALEKSPESFKEKGVKPRTMELLKADKDKAYFSHDLATIRTDVPIDFKLPEKEWRIEDHLETIDVLCDEFEFRTLKERVHRAAHTQKTWKEGFSEDTEEVAELFPQADIDQEKLKEASVGLWLLRSDISNPSLEDILAARRTKEFAEAYEGIRKELKETGRLEEVFETIEKPLIPVTTRMNETGVALDVKYLATLSKEYSKELAKIATRIYKAAGHEFNLNSPKQLGVVLYDELHISPERQKKTATGARTTKEEELLKMKDLHPIIGDILAYRELQKLLSTYIEKIPDMVSEDGRLRATFIQAGTTTGRMASDSPNLQNIPIKSEYGRRIRSGFVAPKGFVLAAIDYSQIELRIAAGLSGDERIVGVFREGRDIHREVASRVFHVEPEKVDREMRRKAKVINFGIIYGMGVNALRANLGGDVSRADAAQFLDDYFKNFAGLREYIDKTKFEAAKNGYTETVFGRRRYFPGFKSTMPGVVAQAERMAVNAPIQGTQADIIKLAMVKVDKMIEEKGWRDKAHLVLQVHDELVYEVAESDAKEIALAIKDAMEHAISAKFLSGVPIIAEASLGKDWGTMERI